MVSTHQETLTAEHLALANDVAGAVTTVLKAHGLAELYTYAIWDGYPSSELGKNEKFVNFNGKGVPSLTIKIMQQVAELHGQEAIAVFYNAFSTIGLEQPSGSLCGTTQTKEVIIGFATHQTYVFIPFIKAFQSGFNVGKGSKK